MRARTLVVFVGVCVVVAFAALELGVRFVVPLSDEFFRPDPAAGVLHIEGRAGRSVSREFDVAVRINNDGFRDRDRARAKPAGTKRVVVLGDSITEALQVPLEETFAARLEQRLAARRPVEVLNLGVSALGPAQEYLVYRAYGARYAPDVVVLALFTANDFRNSVAELDGKPYLRYPVIAGDGTLARDADGTVRFTAPAPQSPLRQWLRAHVKAYRFVREQVIPAIGHPATATASDDIVGVYRQPMPETWRRAVDVTLVMVDELARAAARDGARLVVLVVPAPWEVDPSHRASLVGVRDSSVDWQAPERRVRETLAAKHIDVVSVTAPFAAAIARGIRVYFAGDGHLTAAGHALVADGLAAALGPEL